MIESMKREPGFQIAALVFLAYVGWWVVLQLSGIQETRYHEYFSYSYGITALLGSIIGFGISREWGGWRSKIGRAVTLYSAGLFAQAFGQFVYAYIYFISGKEIPYPSLGDLGYFGSIPLYIYGTMLLADAAGVKFSLKKIHNKIFALVLPLLLLTGSYWVFLNGYEFDLTQPLVIFLDFGYPLGQAIYVSLALLTFLLSRKTLGGVMKNKILLILIALLVQYAADYTFLYQYSKGTWTVAGVNDGLYLVSYFVMLLSLFNLRVSEVRKKLGAS